MSFVTCEYCHPCFIFEKNNNTKITLISLAYCFVFEPTKQSVYKGLLIKTGGVHINQGRVKYFLEIFIVVVRNKGLRRLQSILKTKSILDAYLWLH